MQKKLSFLVCAMACLFSFSQAMAQSAHDRVGGRDSDFDDNTSKFAIKSPDGRFMLGIKGHLQHNNIWEVRPDRDTTFDTTIQRARLKFYGTAFDPSLSYFFQAQFETDSDAPGKERLRDFYLNYEAMNGAVQFRAGKFRTPFDRQQLISTSQMRFYDQHMANGAFQIGANGRDIGIMFHNGFNETIEWALGLTSMGASARLGYNYGGIDGYEMVDFEGGGPRFAIAVDGYYKTDWLSFKQEDLRASVDFVFKVQGFGANGAFYYRSHDNKNKMGAGLDLGYLLAGSFEPVVRYSWLDKNNDATGKAHNQLMAGLNYYAYGHHLKAHLYGGFKMTEWEFKNSDKEFGLQLQFAL